jgi:hypothetical protein
MNLPRKPTHSFKSPVVITPLFPPVAPSLILRIWECTHIMLHCVYLYSGGIRSITAHLEFPFYEGAL